MIIAEITFIQMLVLCSMYDTYMIYVYGMSFNTLFFHKYLYWNALQRYNEYAVPALHLEVTDINWMTSNMRINDNVCQ